MATEEHISAELRYEKLQVTFKQTYPMSVSPKITYNETIVPGSVIVTKDYDDSFMIIWESTENFTILSEPCSIKVTFVALTLKPEVEWFETALPFTADGAASCYPITSTLVSPSDAVAGSLSSKTGTCLSAPLKAVLGATFGGPPQFILGAVEAVTKTINAEVHTVTEKVTEAVIEAIKEGVKQGVKEGVMKAIQKGRWDVIAGIVIGVVGSFGLVGIGAGIRMYFCTKDKEKSGVWYVVITYDDGSCERTVVSSEGLSDFLRKLEKNVHIISINGKKVTFRDDIEENKILEKRPRCLAFEIKRDNQRGTQTVYLEFKEKASSGIKIKNENGNAIVSDLESDSVAANSEKVKVGDNILIVNGESTAELNVAEIEQMMAKQMTYLKVQEDWFGRC